MNRIDLGHGLISGLLALGCSIASAGVPYPTPRTPKPVDAGALTVGAGQQPMTATVALRLHDPEGAHALLESMNTAGSADFQNFLTPEQFRQRFAATDADVARVIASLSRFGLSASRATSTTLQVTGTPAAFEKAFSTKLHRFNVAGHGSVASYSYRDAVLIARGRAYWSASAPIRVIKDGNNDFYQASNGYNPAVGLGVLDVAKFAAALKDLYGR